jgi:enoyl-CoA hydratase/carnithine racemase
MILPLIRKVTDSPPLDLIPAPNAADQLMAKCEAIAGEILKSAPLAVQKMKDLVRQGLDMPLPQGVKLEKEYFDFLMRTEDSKEGALAFAEKRAPNWKAK